MVDLPFEHNYQLTDNLSDQLLWTMPRWMAKNISSSSLERELATPRLDKMAPYLSLMTTPSFENVSSLTANSMRLRNIVSVEDPELHLIWFNDKMFVKPLPIWLTSPAFWEEHLQVIPLGDKGSNSLNAEQDNKSRIRLAAMARGLLRSYTLLIQHPSDLAIAQDLRLIPASIDWQRLSAFLTQVEDRVHDQNVSPRYRFGEIRLSRLNLWSPIFCGQANYLNLHGQYGAYFGRFVGTLVLIFAYLSVATGALQVGIAAEQIDPTWDRLPEIGRMVCYICLIAITATVAAFVCIFVVKVSDEAIYTIKSRLKSNKKTMGTSPA